MLVWHNVSRKKRILLSKFRRIIENSDFLASSFRYIRDIFQLYKKPKKSIYGFLWCGSESMRKGIFEKEEVDIFHSLLKHVDVFVNIGANQGMYCCLALNQKKSVIAIEANPINFKYLMNNIFINNWQNNSKLYPIAAGSSSGIVKMYGGSTGSSIVSGWAGTSSRYSQLVPSVKLDELILHQLDGKQSLILADIEGYEKEMLLGSKLILKLNPKPIWIVEIIRKDHQPSGVEINPDLLDSFEIFWNLGYSSYTNEKNSREIKREEVISISQTGNDSLNTSNFIFIDKKLDIKSLINE